MTLNEKRSYIDRARVLAREAMLAIAPRPIRSTPAAGGLSAAERALMPLSPERTLAALSRLLSHLGPDPGS